MCLTLDVQSRMKSLKIIATVFIRTQRLSLARDAYSKSIALISREIVAVGQDQQRKNSDFVISLDALEAAKILKNHASCVQGLATSDDPQFTIVFWELGSINNGWEGLLG